MVEKNTQEMNQDIIDKINETRYKWQLNEVPVLTREEFIEFCTDHRYEEYFDTLYYYNQSRRLFAERQLTQHEDILGDLLSKDICATIKAAVINMGLYPDVYYVERQFDTLPMRDQLSFIDFLSFDKLKDVALSNVEVKVRIAAIRRLGPIDGLDIALEDSRREVREVGAIWAPKNYEKLRELRDDLSYIVVRHVVKKIPVDELPFMLANRNFSKLKDMSVIAERRMDKEVADG